MSARMRAMAWWQARDGRERAMLAVMLAMLAGFALWYGVFAPLRHLRDAAQARYDRAVSELRVVEATAAEIRALQQRSGPPAGGAAGDQALAKQVLDSASAAGIPVSRQRVDADGALQVDIDAVAAPALLAWLEALRRDHALAPTAVSISRANGALRVELAFPGGEP